MAGASRCGLEKHSATFDGPFGMIARLTGRNRCAGHRSIVLLEPVAL
jgi:hypothetical protein